MFAVRGNWTSSWSTSLPILFRILPSGVPSKKLMGASKMHLIMFSCKFLAALIAPTLRAEVAKNAKSPVNNPMTANTTMRMVLLDTVCSAAGR
uniref:Uncharacterized protein n=1 Tax=Ixodes ricinus TaxID=34613 RepID=A0A6B0U2I8_IXORI